MLFTSSLGLRVDLKIAEMMKDTNPRLKVAFVGPPVTVEPERALQDPAVDFIVRREFDYQIARYATGTPLEELPGGASERMAVLFTIPKAGLSRIWTNYLG